MRIGSTPTGQLVAVHDGYADLLDYEGGLRSLLASGERPQELGVIGRIELDELSLASPLQPGKIVAIGLNYLDHCREASMEPPKTPLIFAKFPSSVIGPDANIEVDRTVTDSVDWEAELGVIIGERMRGVAAEDALAGVWGYTAVNDVSARDLQVADEQWVRAKSIDTFCPVGPLAVSRDEIADPQTLEIWTDVNGVRMQDSSTSEMIFGVAELLAYCSKSFTLEPGDLLITGTPWGVGVVRQPPVLLHDGDTVTVGIESIGTLTNRVVDL